VGTAESVSQPLSPLRGSSAAPLFPHGLRRGLDSCAASRFFVDPLLHFLLVSKVVTQSWPLSAVPRWFVVDPARAGRSRLHCVRFAAKQISQHGWGQDRRHRRHEHDYGIGRWQYDLRLQSN